MNRSTSNSKNSFVMKRNIFLAVVGVLVAAAVILTVYFAVSSANSGGSPVAEPVSGATAEDGKVIINDLYEGEITIPKFNVPLNQYDPEKFINTSGVVTYDSASARLGIDVSDFQGDIDWAAVKESGIDFVMIRAGYRGATRGLLNEDSKFQQNYDGATAAGLDVGVYFFSQATSVSEAEEEAGYLLQLLQDKPLTYPAVFDWEFTDVEGSRTAAATGEQITSYALAFCKKIGMGGYKPAVYFNRSLGYNYYNLETLKDYDFWLAEYRNIPAFYYNFNLWQYSDNAQVKGITEPVDINVCFNDY